MNPWSFHTYLQKLQPGPCMVCGLTDYPLSMGGPEICPACDCGISPTDSRHPLEHEPEQSAEAEDEQLEKINVVSFHTTEVDELIAELRKATE
jgi:hypothetical protein